MSSALLLLRVLRMLASWQRLRTRLLRCSLELRATSWRMKSPSQSSQPPRPYPMTSTRSSKSHSALRRRQAGPACTVFYAMYCLLVHSKKPGRPVLRCSDSHGVMQHRHVDKCQLTKSTMMSIVEFGHVICTSRCDTERALTMLSL